MKERLNPEVRKIIQNKKILLFKELLVLIDFDDIAVVDLLLLGIKLVENVAKSGVWRPDPTKRARISVEELWRSARQAQSKVLEEDQVLMMVLFSAEYGE